MSEQAAASDADRPRPHLTGWLGTVLGTPDPRGLARFYSDLLGWPITDEGDDWCTIALPGARANLAFQREDHHERPVWPAEPGRQQMMMHLDIGVRDLGEAVRHAQVAGAELAGFQPQDDVRVMIDPAGHPFCLYVDEDP
jgi:catechol 2,3-dioxygenase-like lactoylglutathione lyase family enzyme